MANAFSLSPAGDHNLPPQSLFCSPLGGGLLREGGGEGARSVRQMAGGLPVGGAGGSPAFTASQYEELQVQALIYKHLLMGVPVPQELLLSVRRSLESMATRLYNPHPFGYYSYFGKKFDPEPGRCRRTDGKKWRCSKDAYPDSKYCERHMHRGRNRSRKPVESPPLLSQAQPPPTAAGSIVAESLAPSMNGGGSSSCSSSLQSIHMHSLASTQVPFSSAQIESASSGLSSKEFRYPYQVKPELGQHSFFSESSTGSAKGLGMDSTLDNPWTVMPSQMSLFPLSKMTNSYPQLSPVDNLGQATLSSLSKQDQVPHSFFGGELGAVESAKQGQSLHPFMDDWPKTRTSWPDLEGGRSNLNSYSTTELSISIPMASSDFSSSSSRTPNGTSS